MQIEVQRAPVANPQAVPGPLSEISPGFLQPISGVQDTSQGIEQGDALAGPLSQAGQALIQYNLPETIAERQAAIANANLQTTNATQQNTAAQNTPNIPLQARQVQGLGLTDQGRTIQAQLNNNIPEQQGALAGVTIGNQTQAQKNVASTTVPSDTTQYSTYLKPQQAGDTAEPMPQIQSDYQKLQATHPELNLPTLAFTSDDDINEGLSSLKAYAAQGDPAQQAAIAQAKREAQVSIASNPMFSMMANGQMKNHHFEGKNLVPDALTAETITDPQTGQPTFQTFNKTTGQWILPSGDPDPNQTKTAARQIMLDRAAASVGAYNGPNSALQSFSNANQLDDPSLSKPQQTAAGNIGRQFNSIYAKNYEPKLQLFASFDSVAQKALDPATASGVPDVDLIDTAGRLYKGGAMTETQYEAIQKASGLPASIWNFPAKIGQGKVLTPQQRQDLIGSVQNYKNDLQNAFQQDYTTYASKLKQLNPNANVQLWLGNASAMSPSQGAANTQSSQPSSAQDSSGLPVVNSKADMDALPAGSKFQTSDGTVYSK